MTYPRLLMNELEPALLAATPVSFGRVASIDGQRMSIAGLAGLGRIGDRAVIKREGGAALDLEIIGANGRLLVAYAFGAPVGVSAGDRVCLQRFGGYSQPSESWLGETLNWCGLRPDGSAPRKGAREFLINAPPPPASFRKRLGPRLATHHAVFDTFLPLCRGQRIGLFAGSGVGKSMLLSSLVRQVEADICVVAMIGERGREVRSFLEDALTEWSRPRSVVIASTSDESALAKRQCARLAMTTAEYFRSRGAHVLLVFDSLTRFAEAHREIALAAGEPPSLHAYPPSTFGALSSLVERAGPGVDGEGDITAVFSVLVAGSDMEEPVADMVRGILDGHVILDRKIAERGRFPAIDVRRSVSRSLPAAASAEENELLHQGRSILSAYEDSEMIVRAGLYADGADAAIDQAIKIWPALDRFFTIQSDAPPEHHFSLLQAVLADEPQQRG